MLASPPMTAVPPFSTTTVVRAVRDVSTVSSSRPTGSKSDTSTAICSWILLFPMSLGVIFRLVPPDNSFSVPALSPSSLDDCEINCWTFEIKLISAGLLFIDATDGAERIDALFVAARRCKFRLRALENASLLEYPTLAPQGEVSALAAFLKNPAPTCTRGSPNSAPSSINSRADIDTMWALSRTCVGSGSIVLRIFKIWATISVSAAIVSRSLEPVAWTYCLRPGGRSWMRSTGGVERGR